MKVQMKTVWFGLLHIEIGCEPVAVALFETEERAKTWLDSPCGWNFEASIEQGELTENEFSINANQNKSQAWKKYFQ